MVWPRKQMRFAKPAEAQAIGRGEDMGSSPPPLATGVVLGLRCQRAAERVGGGWQYRNARAGNGAGLILDLRFLI